LYRKGDNCTGVPESAEDDNRTDDICGLEVDDCSNTDIVNDSTPITDVSNVTVHRAATNVIFSIWIFGCLNK